MTRQGISHRAVYAVFFGLVAVALTAGALLYFGKLRYVPKAARHAPRDAVVLARISVERVGLFDPTRTHLMPLADSVGAPPGATPRRLRLEKTSKLEFNVDLREVFVSLGPGPDDWVLVFGGMFPRADWVSRIAAVLEQEGRTGRLQSGVWADAAGFFVAQAADGCLIVSSSRRTLDSALPAAEAPGPRGDLELLLRPGGMQFLRSKGLDLAAGVEIETVVGMAAGTGVEVEIASAAAGSHSADITGILESWGAKKVEQNGRIVRASFEREGLNRAGAELASWLKRRLGVPALDAGRAKAR